MLNKYDSDKINDFMMKDFNFMPSIEVRMLDFSDKKLHELSKNVNVDIFTDHSSHEAGGSSDDLILDYEKLKKYFSIELR